KSWFTNSPGFTYLVSALAINGNNLFVGTEPNGIFLSTDNGKNWTPINNGINQTGKYSVNSFFVNGVEIYTAANGKIYVSNNYGTSWTADTNGLMGYDATSIIMLDNKLLAGTINGVYVSSPNGGSWSADTTGLPYLTAVLSMTYDNYYVYI